jgi:DNA-binding MarR family transcriptional regulator
MRIDPDQWNTMRAHMRKHVQEIAGDESASGLELAGLIRGLANLYETTEIPPDSPLDLSGPRWFLLLRLLAEEREGNWAGVTPTALSNNQNVSKNTISSLLRGLEEQGLIQRDIDADDKRIFRIQLTPHGRELMAIAAPLRIRHLNRLASGLLPEEQEQLFQLLIKLFRSLVKNCKQPVDTPVHL